MATGPEEISHEEYVGIFGESDEENEEFFDAENSDLDEDILTWDESESDEDESDEFDEEDQDAWSDALEDFDIEAFDPSNSGIQVEVPDDASALFFFKLLFDEDLMDHVIAETNRLARQKRANKPHLIENWCDIGKQEFKAYLGLCIMMGICVLPQTAGYWSSDPYLENRGVQSKMTKNRFEEIRQYLHFSDSSIEPPKGSPDYDRLYKCRPILTKVVENVQRAYYPGQNIAIDEAMIAFKGRLGFRQYMPAKPTKYGIKVWMAADSQNGYVNNMAVYQGSEEGKEGYTHGQGYDIVMSMARPFLNKNHHLFFDNFFSSVRLFDHLLSQDTYACATVRSNRKELPRCAKQKLKQPGELICAQKGKLLYTKWHDKRDVNFLSTNVCPGIAPRLVERKIKRQIVEIEKPYVSDLYTSKMGGVDQADQLRSYYYAGRQSRRWYRYVFWFLFNVCICNAHILESIHRGRRKRKQLQFRMALAKELIDGFSQRKRPASFSPGEIRVRLTHKSVRCEGRKRQCVHCKKANRKTPKGYPVETSFKCEQCGIALCKAPCFMEYHQA